MKNNKNFQKKYTIGTRKSLLALTQTNQIKTELEKKTNCRFEIKGYTTSGDIQNKKPLSELEGKNFFTKELDKALLNKEIDLVIHSCKDLGKDRPQGLTVGAITKRKYPHDILLIRKEFLRNFSHHTELVVGTSSPRRIELAQERPRNILPLKLQDLKISFKVLRGNVNSRLRKLQEKNYDAIILALAGLERLSCNDEINKDFLPLLNDLDFVVLPLTLFPPAAGQGALAVEYRAEDIGTELSEVIKTVDDPDTKEEVLYEKKHFGSYGGGCHLPMGIYTKKLKKLFIHIIKGKFGQQKINQLNIERDLQLTKYQGTPQAFIGLPAGKYTHDNNFTYDEVINKKILDTAKNFKAGHFFITSSYSSKFFKRFAGSNKNFIWTSGKKTSEDLLKSNIWVHGQSDSFGHDEIKKFSESKFIQAISGMQNWTIITHDQGESDFMQHIPSYTRETLEVSPHFIHKIKQIKSFFWTSYYQFEVYTHLFPFLLEKDILHCHGLGKTWEKFEKSDIKTIPFLAISDFKDWILS